MAQGMPESSASRVLHHGWYCPHSHQRDYPQHDGAGGFAILETPARFVRASVLRTLAQWEIVPSPDRVADLTQDGLLACWTRRHAPHIQHVPRSDATMLRGLVARHGQRLQREQQWLRPWEEVGPCAVQQRLAASTVRVYVVSARRLATFVKNLVRAGLVPEPPGDAVALSRAHAVSDAATAQRAGHLGQPPRRRRPTPTPRLHTTHNEGDPHESLWARPMPHSNAS